jgi:hypothetical protein
MAILDVKQGHQTQFWKRTIQEVTSEFDPFWPSGS